MDEYLKKQNKILCGIGLVIFLLATLSGIFLFLEKHYVLACIQFGVLVTCSIGTFHTVHKNTIYADKWKAINQIEMGVCLDSDDGLEIMERHVGNLNFTFRNDE